MCGEVCLILKEPVERWRNLGGHNLLQLMYQGRKTPSVKYTFLFIPDLFFFAESVSRLTSGFFMTTFFQLLFKYVR
jgi:hypothetical protein